MGIKIPPSQTTRKIPSQVKNCLPEIGEEREYVIHGAVNFYQELNLPAKQVCHLPCKKQHNAMYLLKKKQKKQHDIYVIHKMKIDMHIYKKLSSFY